MSEHILCGHALYCVFLSALFCIRRPSDIYSVYLFHFSFSTIVMHEVQGVSHGNLSMGAFKFTVKSLLYYTELPRSSKYSRLSPLTTVKSTESITKESQ